MSESTMSMVKARKKLLEKHILTVVKVFEEENGVHVERIRLSGIESESGEREYTECEVDVSIP